MTVEARGAQRARYHHGDLRAQLIAAVRDLVETHGPDGFSVAEAARRAGVRSAAPYKHFKDRPEILRAVAAQGLDTLHDAIVAAADRHPRGSLEPVAAIGVAYVDFARAQPGVFRLVFGLTEGHEAAPHLLSKGQDCFGVVKVAVGACIGRPAQDAEVLRRAYLVWALVHGHSFLIIDRKTDIDKEQIDDWSLMMAASRAVLGGGAAS